MCAEISACCSVLQCVAVCCSVLQCVAVCYTYVCRDLSLLKTRRRLTHIYMCTGLFCGLIGDH